MKDDKTLIVRVQTGDLKAFRELVEKYNKLIYYFSYDLTGHHQDAEDLSQEIFIKVFRSIKKFRGDAMFSTWLYKVAVNTWHDMRRSKTYRIRNMQELDEKKVGTITTDPDTYTERSLFQERLQKALGGLTPRERTVFIMRHYHEQKISDIGKTLNIASGTVKSTLFRTIKKLQANLDSYRNDLEMETLS
jgi:RNA polymerase sigma-70 factor (ECF subfamily)